MHGHSPSRAYICHCNGKERLFFGVALIAVGSLFLLNRLGIVPLGEPWYLLPAVVAILGVARIVFAQRTRHVLNGLFAIGLAGWAYVCMQQLWGWTFATTWPIILIALGVKAVAGGILGTHRHSQDHSHKESEQ
jgi:hypothetical protein